jgi:hypothetical protein
MNTPHSSPAFPDQPGTALLPLLQLPRGMREADAIKLIGDIYQAVAANFLAANPAQAGRPVIPFLLPAPALPCDNDAVQALMAKYDRHYYFPLVRLMQLLPGDITNAPRLTPEQGKMCEAVASFAAQAWQTLSTGVAAIDALRALVCAHAPGAALPDTGALVAYLRAEANFMEENKDDYRDAADNIRRVI